MIELPRFDLPFPSDISPMTDSIIEHTSWWARSVGLVRRRRAVRHLRSNGIMHAGPRLVPNAPMTEACLVCDWTVFLIVIDDEFDDGRELGMRPDLAQAAIEDVVASFRGQQDGRAFSFAHLAGIAATAADLGRRFAASAPSQEWLTRFNRHAEEHIWSKVTEAKQRTSDAVLDVAAYVDLRRVTGAPYTYSDLVEMAEQVLIPVDVQQTQAWALMLDAFADVWLGIQDICSCAKEVAAGDDLNIAAVMARSGGSSLQQGVDDAYLWVCERAWDFAAQRAHLARLLPRLRLGDGHSARTAAETDVERYLDSLERLIGGHLAWNSQDNPRYTQVISRSQAR
jgi:Terpene synthase family 2, C-terminal metal binding